ELSRKDGNLVNNVNKFNIKTGNVVVTLFPTRESEWAHRDDTEWEYGFYELPLEKIPKGKLLFREALEASKRVSEEHLDRIWQYFRPFGKVDKQDVIYLFLSSQFSIIE
uniref:SET domain-containing protein n=1 Tax=Syphacia muris TaxID=451379 RepID=A0A158R3S8_9BILA